MLAPAPRKSLFPDPKDRSPAILVVEDDTLIRFVISNYLQACGFRVHVAGNAEEAIRILGAEAVIDLVFSDVKRPADTTSGFGLAQWVRKNRPGVQVILTSGDARMIAAAQELCKNEPIFAKPYNLAQVITHIRRLIVAEAQKPKPR